MGLIRRLKRYPLTALWIFSYLVSLFLSFNGGMDPVAGYYLLVISTGIPLTLLVYVEWSVHIIDRKNAILNGAIFVAIWIFSMLMTMLGYPWAIWHSLNTVGLIGFTFVAGSWLSGEIEKSGHLIPVCVIAMLVDVWSVFAGPSKKVGEQVIEHMEKQSESAEYIAPPIGNFLLLNWPQPGQAIMSPVFGLGDLVFIALFLTASRKFGLNLWVSLLAIALGLLGSLITAFMFNTPIPALPFICGFFLIGHYKKLSLTQKEKAMTIAISAFIIVAGVIRYAINYFTNG
jgi:hypothetical protein